MLLSLCWCLLADLVVPARRSGGSAWLRLPLACSWLALRLASDRHNPTGPSAKHNPSPTSSQPAASQRSAVASSSLVQRSHQRARKKGDTEAQWTSGRPRAVQCSAVQCSAVQCSASAIVGPSPRLREERDVPQHARTHATCERARHTQAERETATATATATNHSSMAIRLADSSARLARITDARSHRTLPLPLCRFHPPHPQPSLSSCLLPLLSAAT